MKVTFGYSITGEDDYFIQLAAQTFSILMQIVKPGVWLCDSIPICVSGFVRSAWSLKAHYSKILAWMATRRWIQAKGEVVEKTTA